MNTYQPLNTLQDVTYINQCTTTSCPEFCIPVVLHAAVYDDRIEIDYKSEYNYPSFDGNPKIWRDVYKVVDGKLTKTDTIEGVWYKAQDSHYTIG